ncbi:hypothetical protein [Catellatospora sp. NPDC049609]|uniref:hypothetical protein n=1 Tax=Catellatospora sp. NPDC049609 TaxID=3155505 RepID=UPI0034179BE6
MASQVWQRLRKELAIPLALLGATVEILLVFGVIAAVTSRGDVDVARLGLGVAVGIAFAVGIALALRLRREAAPGRSVKLMWLTVGTYAAGYLAWLLGTHVI